MLCCPRRSPFSASNRLAGGIRKSSSCLALFSILSLRRATVCISCGRRREVVPPQIFSVSLSAKSRIIANYNECRYMTSSVMGHPSVTAPFNNQRCQGRLVQKSFSDYCVFVVHRPVSTQLDSVNKAMSFNCLHPQQQGAGGHSHFTD